MPFPGRLGAEFDTELTPLGRQQAALTAETVAALDITHLVCSPLVRALDTAHVIAERLVDMPIDVWMELRENHDRTFRSYGRQVLMDRFPLAALPAAITEDGWDFGGDTAVAASERGRTVLRLIQERFGPTDRVALVAHGGCLSHFMHALVGLPPASPYWFDMGNCAISHIRLIPEAERQDNPVYPHLAVIVRRLNDTSHLYDAASQA